MHGQWIWWVSGVLGVGAAVGAFFIVRHQLYLRELRDRGWAWNSRPQLEDFLNYQVPPFGLGVNRAVDDLVSGTTPDGRRFDSFEYRFDGANTYKRRVLSIELPAALPLAFVVGSEPRAGIEMGAPNLFEAVGGGLTVIASSAEFASEVHGVVAGAIGTLPAGQVVDLSIDGDRLVYQPVDRNPGQLAVVVDALAPVAASLAGLAGAWAVPAPTPRYGFYGHPDWEYLGSDDSVLNLYPTTEGGFGHETEALIRGARDGIRMDSFVHNWKTTEIRTVADGQGGTRVETYTEEHSEAICGFLLPYTLPTLSVNGSWGSERVRFESEDFNKAFTVRTDSAKYASDVIHPRTMEWLLATCGYGWSMTGPMALFEIGSMDIYAIDACEAILRGFLGRIPRFVWDDLGLPVPPFLVE
jgi:hypothetical protein